MGDTPKPPPKGFHPLWNPLAPLSKESEGNLGSLLGVWGYPPVYLYPLLLQEGEGGQGDEVSIS